MMWCFFNNKIDNLLFNHLIIKRQKKSLFIWGFSLALTANCKLQFVVWCTTLVQIEIYRQLMDWLCNWRHIHVPLRMNCDKQWTTFLGTTCTYNWIISIFLTCHCQQHVSLSIHLWNYKDVKADRNGAGLPAWLNCQSALVFLGDFVPSGRQRCVKAISWKRKRR